MSNYNFTNEDTVNAESDTDEQEKCIDKIPKEYVPDMQDIREALSSVDATDWMLYNKIMKMTQKESIALADYINDKFGAQNKG